MLRTLQFGLGFGALISASGWDYFALFATVFIASGRLTLCLIQLLAQTVSRLARRSVQQSRFIALNLPTGFRVETSRITESLCNACVYAHIVRGYNHGEESVFCGYAFPFRDVLFTVRECTDFKSKDMARGNRKAGFGVASGGAEWEEVTLASVVLTNSDRRS